MIGIIPFRPLSIKIAKGGHNTNINIVSGYYQIKLPDKPKPTKFDPYYHFYGVPKHFLTSNKTISSNKNTLDKYPIQEMHIANCRYP